RKGLRWCWTRRLFRPSYLPRVAPARNTHSDRPPAHLPAARIQALDQPVAGSALPVLSDLLGVRDAGHYALWRAQRQLARAAPYPSLPPPASGRQRSGAAGVLTP